MQGLVEGSHAAQTGAIGEKAIPFVRHCIALCG